MPVNFSTELQIEMTKEEQAAYIIDNLMVLFEVYQDDYHIVRMALGYIAEVREKNPNHPITVSLANYMRKKGLIE